MATTYNLIDSIPNPKDLVAGDVLKFQQTGWVEKRGPTSNENLNQVFMPNMGVTKEIILPAGQYKLECWGAQGGNGPSEIPVGYQTVFPALSSSYRGGLGGYSTGIISLTEKTNLFLYPGGHPLAFGYSVTGNGWTESVSTGGFNGGQDGHIASTIIDADEYKIYLGHGGGGTDIRIGQDSLYARVIVAGGGGGAPYGGDVSTYSYGGGLTGGAYSNKGVPGGQTVELTDEEKEENPEKYFGKAEKQSTYSGQTIGSKYGYTNGVAGSGGGWYGGTSYSVAYSGTNTNFTNTNLWTTRCSAGGSGYVYTEFTASNYPSGCLLDSSHYLEDAQTIAGNQSFPSFDTSANETGHQGMGAIRITVLDISKFSVYIKANNIWKQADSAYIKNNSGVWVPVDSIHVKNNNLWS